MMTTAYRPAVTTDSVCDLSHNNAIKNPGAAFKTAAAAIPGFTIIHKASQGVAMVDRTFAPRRAAAEALGIPFGAYHFCDGSDPTAQADFFLKSLGDAAGLVLALDAERNKKSQVTVAEVGLIASRIHARVGIWPGIYMGKDGPADDGKGLPSKTLAANCWLWLPEYGNNPVCPPGWGSWALWQHTDGRLGSAVAPVPGIGPCDRSHFAGTAEELRAWWAAHAVPGGAHAAPQTSQPQPAAPPAEVTPEPVDIRAVQQMLNAAGIDPPLKVDGIAGTETQDAISAFQAAKGLPTGKLDAATLAALKAAA